ncbi:LysR substrate-binding domain-containing protein [Photobacterium sp. DNB23_23_1]|uniref:LysR substrate-binding domain-containing protein n=1 Tax=Photobacterium pectinilyticum TaxID=2906793 RepID=A0ABT1N4Z7_9GAMM|nr:LysR substrate-binding domain-containing protein [Photobacterium sp. ZSDE20]MCQ1059803.1 LysR substrate-binding domain-containing protein [Photobacterium sp. ZSDE20]MDD1826140.1 LysR substrate-binding domain-containing protein [Photobacterium sp. ZSDE20]
MLNMQELPSIRALRTFIAVANHLSFSKAAKELSVTQGAVSKQISHLEQQLGQPLFERHLNGIRLSSVGLRYLPQIAETLEALQNATASLRQLDQVDEVLTVNVTPSFASLWLIPLINRFAEAFPNIQVQLKTGDGPVQDISNENDIVIRCLPLAKYYENATLLCRENLRLVASAELLRKTPIRHSDDLAKHVFLPQVTRPQLWEQFKTHHDIEFPMAFYGVGFEHFYMSLAAVECQQGLALLPDFMVEGLIAKRELFNPLNITMESHYGYYIIVPNYKRHARKVCVFNQWIGEMLS